MSERYLLISGYGADSAPGVRLARYDVESGALSVVDELAGIRNASFVIPHPTQPWFFVTSETGEASKDGPGAVWSGRYEKTPSGSFRLSALNQQASGGDWPCHLALDAGGRWLFVANYGTGSMSVLPVLGDGSLGARSAHVQHQGSGPNAERQEGPHAHSTTLTPDGGAAIVADLGIDALVFYSLDSATGHLTGREPVGTRPGSGPRHLVFRPDGTRLYVAHELDSTVSVFSTADGRYTEIQTEPTVPPGVGENSVADIHVSPDGTRLYVSNRGHNSLAIFAVDGDGALKPLGHASCGGNWPRNFAIAPDGRHVLAGNQYSGDVAVLPVLDAAPWLGASVARLDVPQVACVAFLPEL